MNNTTDATFISAQFHVVDYLILVVMILISLGIGLFYGCVGNKQRSTNEYFKANRNMSMIPVVLSLLASFISSNGMLGFPAEVYLFGFGIVFNLLGGIIGIPVAAFCFLPVFYELQITSVYEYLERRFNRVVRICGSLMAITTMILYASFVAYGPALALSQVTGFHLWGSILATTFIGTFYTSLGGIRAVMCADSAQLIVFTIALVAVVFKGTIDAGGVSSVINQAIEGQRLQPISFSFDPRVRFTLWGFLISSTIGWTAAYGVSQIQVQRYLACPTRKAATKGLFLNYPGMAFVDLLYGFMGLLLFARYWNCDPITSKQIEAADQILPLFVMESMGNLTGLTGLFVAGVYSASLSTTSSVLNSFSALILEDFIRPCKRWKDMNDETATKVSKFLAILGAAICLLIISAVKNLGSIVQTGSYLTGTTVGGNFALFSLGMFFPKANAKGTLLGLICGVSVAWWLVIGNQIYQPLVSKLPLSVEGCSEDRHQDTSSSENQYIDSEIPEFYKLSYLWIKPIAFFVTFIMGGLASFIIGSNKEETDEKYFTPPVRYIMKRYFKSKRQMISADKAPAYETVALEEQSETATDAVIVPPSKADEAIVKIKG